MMTFFIVLFYSPLFSLHWKHAILLTVVLLTPGLRHTFITFSWPYTDSLYSCRIYDAGNLKCYDFFKNFITATSLFNNGPVSWRTCNEPLWMILFAPHSYWDYGTRLWFTLVKPKKKWKEKKNIHHHFTTVTINSSPVTKNTDVVQLVPGRVLIREKFLTKRNNMV